MWHLWLRPNSYILVWPLQKTFFPKILKLCAVWHIVSRLLCGISVAMTFFWQLNHTTHFPESASFMLPLEIATPISFWLLYFSWSYLWFFSLHCQQFSCQMLQKCMLVYLTEVWFQRNPSMSTFKLEFQHCWLDFSVPWISFYIRFLFCTVQLLFHPNTLTILLLWLRNQRCQCSTAWKMQGFVRGPETHTSTVHIHIRRLEETVVASQ